MIATLALVSLACTPSPVRVAPIPVSINVKGEDRSSLVLPGVHSKDTPSPLLLYFHGFGGDEDDSLRRRTFPENWPSATIVYPRGTKVVAGQDALGWTKRYHYENEDKDIVFVERLIEKVSTLVKVDKSRIYVSGHSSGGFFAMSLWALRPDIVAGSAPISCYGRYELDEAAVKRPIFYVFGLRDKVFDNDPPDRIAGPDLARSTVQQLLTRNGHASAIQEGVAFQEIGQRGHGASTVRWRLHGQGHSWPTGLEKDIVKFFRETRKAGVGK